MIGFIKKDFYLIKKNLVTMAILAICLVIIMNFTDFGVAFVIPYLSVVLYLSTFSYDEYNKWDVYACSLPDGREKIVKSKYVGMFLCVLFLILVTLVIDFVVNSTMMATNGMTIGDSVGYYLDVTIKDVLPSLLGSGVATILVVAFMYPILFKFGAVKGRLVVFAIIYVGIALFYLLFTNLGSIIHGSWIGNIIHEYYNYWPLALMVVLVIIVTGSYLISKKIYLKKEF